MIGFLKIATRLLSRGDETIRNEVMAMLEELFVEVRECGGGITAPLPPVNVSSPVNATDSAMIQYSFDPADNIVESRSNMNDSDVAALPELADGNPMMKIQSYVQSSNNVFHKNSDTGKLNVSKLPGETAPVATLFIILANQIACHMWKLLTSNVAVLPLLTLKQWQTLFDIIGATASSSDFAAMKSFEVRL